MTQPESPTIFQHQPYILYFPILNPCHQSPLITCTVISRSQSGDYMIISLNSPPEILIIYVSNACPVTSARDLNILHQLQIAVIRDFTFIKLLCKPEKLTGIINLIIFPRLYCLLICTTCFTKSICIIVLMTTNGIIMKHLDFIWCCCRNRLT